MAGQIYFQTAVLHWELSGTVDARQVETELAEALDLIGKKNYSSVNLLLDITGVTGMDGGAKEALAAAAGHEKFNRVAYLGMGRVVCFILNFIGIFNRKGKRFRFFTLRYKAYEWLNEKEL